MYKKFFGFKERPFQLVPNPAYLFLSRSHEEAMAHLGYAIAQGDGFIEITGEVGTGKTTLCRAFLESLGEDTEAAYIFNPKLDSIQLMKTINDEFGIDSEPDNIKDLLDILNAFLMEKKAEGKKVIILIDEAQNLSKEVLEQVRLLSNLETTTSKLLQIILVGQPELGDMLDSHELRQLGQRVSLSCHIAPLNAHETKNYIDHRIHIASQRTEVKFTRGAYRAVHKYSGGIPRLINIACDRALLTAYGLNRKKITGGIVGAAIRELSDRGTLRRYGLRERRNSVFLLLVLCLILVLVVHYRPRILDVDHLFPIPSDEGQRISQKKESKKEIQKLREPDKGALEKKPVEEKVLEAPPSKEPMRDLKNYLVNLKTRTSRSSAMKTVLKLWNNGSEMSPFLDNVDDDEGFFELAARQGGLTIHRIKDDLILIQKLNIPAILEFFLPGGLSPRYLTLIKIEGEKIIFGGEREDEIIETEQAELRSLWSGVAYVPWKNFLNYTGNIPLNSPRDSIIALKMLIHDLGFSHIVINPFYDAQTKDVIKKIQEKHGLAPDGIVGPLTKIVLYNEKKSLKIPHIAPLALSQPVEGAHE